MVIAFHFQMKLAGILLVTMLLFWTSAEAGLGDFVRTDFRRCGPFRRNFWRRSCWGYQGRDVLAELEELDNDVSGSGQLEFCTRQGHWGRGSQDCMEGWEWVWRE